MLLVLGWSDLNATAETIYEAAVWKLEDIVQEFWWVLFYNFNLIIVKLCKTFCIPYNYIFETFLRDNFIIWILRVKYKL